MAASGSSFGISLGLNAAFGLVCLVIFGLLRARLDKFYSVKRHLTDAAQPVKPRRLSGSFWGWIKPTLQAPEEELIAVAGIDAAVYIRLLNFGLQLFLCITVWVLVVVLPTNLAGHEVTRLQTSPPVQQGFAYWLSPPPPARAGAPPAPEAQVKAPPFYDETPPAPPGLIWWRYRADVPPLPDPATTLGSNFTRYGWRYDQSSQSRSYTFTDLDTLTMSNMAPHSHKLWVHLVSVWVITLFTLWLLKRNSKWALAMRLRHLAVTSAESSTILVQDIPGIFYGTLLQRLDALFLPGFLKRLIRSRLMATRRRKLASSESKAKDRDLLPHHMTRSDQSFAAASTPEKAEAGATAKLSRAMSHVDAWQRPNDLLSQGLSPQQIVEREYEELYPGQVAAVHLVYDNRPLRKMQAEYGSTVQKLLDLVDKYTSQRSRGKPVKRKTAVVLGALYGAWGERHFPSRSPVRTDALLFYTERLKELRQQIKAGSEPTSTTATASAFVTFRSRRMQALAAEALQHQDRRAWQVSSAPAPQDLLWTNVRWRRWEHLLRGGIIWGLFVVLTLFYLVPVSAVQALIEVDRLNQIGFFRALTQIRFVNAILQAILPSLVLKLFIVLLPHLLHYLNIRQGMVALSEVDAGVIQKFFIFQVVTVFLGSFLAGSLFSQFTAWAEHPASAITILGTSAPLTSIFFLNYISLSALAATPLSFLRPFGLLRYSVLSCLAGSPRAQARVWQQNYMFFGQDVSSHTITILLGLVFCVINPLLAPMCVVYFAIVLTTERYNMLYTERPQYHAGGKMWGQVFTHVITALLLFQIIMAALLAIKQSFSAILVLPLIIITALTAAGMGHLYRRPTASMALRAAVDADLITRQEEGEEAGPPAQGYQDQGPASSAYTSPIFRFDEDAHAAALKEAEDMHTLLEGRQPQNMRLAPVQEEDGEEEDQAAVQNGPSRSVSPERRNRGRSGSQSFAEPDTG